MGIQKNYNHTEKLYTYEEWKKYYTESQRKRKSNTTYFIIQKLVGLALIIISIIVPFLLSGDATVSVLSLPLGLFTLFTKERILTI